MWTTDSRRCFANPSLRRSFWRGVGLMDVPGVEGGRGLVMRWGAVFSERVGEMKRAARRRMRRRVDVEDFIFMS